MVPTASTSWEPVNTNSLSTRKKFRPRIDSKACKGCLICVYVCETKGGKVLKATEEATSMGGLLPTLDGDCIGCRWCERYCPDFAISVEEVEEY